MLFTHNIIKIKGVVVRVNKPPSPGEKVNRDRHFFQNVILTQLVSKAMNRPSVKRQRHGKWQGKRQI